MNREKAILTKFRRRLIDKYNAAEKYSNRRDVLLEVLIVLVSIETDADLGEETESGLPLADGEEDE